LPKVVRAGGKIAATTVLPRSYALEHGKSLAGGQIILMGRPEACAQLGGQFGATEIVSARSFQLKATAETPEDVRRLLAEDQAHGDHPRPAHLRGHDITAAQLTVTPCPAFDRLGAGLRTVLGQRDSLAGE
jgi:hypothetical protein